MFMLFMFICLYVYVWMLHPYIHTSKPAHSFSQLMTTTTRASHFFLTIHRSSSSSTFPFLFSRFAQSLGSSSSSCTTTNTVSLIETGHVQRTLAGVVTCVGKGLHSGEEARLTLHPAAAGEGRYFVSTNGISREKILVTADNVVDTKLSTCLGVGNSKVRTVEHLMSALEGIGVNNCRIEIRGGEEVPLLDGSASEWVKAIEHVGLSNAIDRQGSQIPVFALKVHKPIFAFDGDSFVAAFPAPATMISCGVDFPQKAIGRQWFTWYPSDDSNYKKEVAAARTFAIYEQIEHLQQAGLIKGGSLDNALVCSETGWLNPPLRFPDEPCRHKLLDLVGDLALSAQSGHSGLPVAHIIAFKASHSLHVKFSQAVLQAVKDT